MKESRRTQGDRTEHKLDTSVCRRTFLFGDDIDLKMPRITARIVANKGDEAQFFVVKLSDRRL
jgi:hypothetical protein